MRMSWVLWKDPKSLPLGARSRECDNKRTKKLILLLKFARNTYHGSKKNWLHDNFVLQN